MTCTGDKILSSGSSDAGSSTNAASVRLNELTDGSPAAGETVNAKDCVELSGSVSLTTVIFPQLRRSRSPGPTRSFIWAWPLLPDERLTAKTEPSARHSPGPKTPASVRLMIASPNSTRPWVSEPSGGSSSSTANSVLTAASAAPAAVKSWVLPQHPSVSSPSGPAPEISQV